MNGPLEDDESMESIRQFKIYCSLEIMPSLAEVNDCYNMCQEVDTLIVLGTVHILRKHHLYSTKLTLTT